MRQVFFLSNGLAQDISTQILDIPKVTQSVGGYGQTLISEIPSIVGNNIRGFWDAQNPSSFLHGATDFSGYELHVYQDGIRVFGGGIKTVTASNDNRTATIELRSALSTALEKGCIFSSDVETPASAVSRIAQFYGIPIDLASFANSHALYELDSVYISVALIQPTMTVMAVFQDIAEKGVARIYSINGTLFFDAYTAATAAPVYTFTDVAPNADGLTIWQKPEVMRVEKEQTKGYSINTVDGPAPFGPPDDRGKVIEGGNDSPIRINSLQAGVWIGERWLEYLGAPQNRVTFGAPPRIASALGLGMPIELQYTRQNWDTITLDIVEIDTSSRVLGLITGLTR